MADQQVIEMSEAIRYAVIVIGRERSNLGHVIGPRNQRYWVMNEPDGWVEATSQPVDENEPAPAGLKTWATEDEAVAFAERWDGHPWWCAPRAYEVITVNPAFVVERKLVGYQRAATVAKGTRTTVAAAEHQAVQK
jgi:hypothetical protein